MRYLLLLLAFPAWAESTGAMCVNIALEKQPDTPYVCTAEDFERGINELRVRREPSSAGMSGWMLPLKEPVEIGRELRMIFNDGRSVTCITEKDEPTRCYAR